MFRPPRCKLCPWIESLILSYGGEESSNNSERLIATVIGLGQMSHSQAHGSEGPTGLLFLSDGSLRIPAILTVAAWEHLQEQEERESFTSLLNTTVCIQDYRLQFYMAQEETKCRFFLSIRELTTSAAGPVKDNTPCCMSLPSVRLKICRTWRDLQGQGMQETQASQYGFDMSVLLGEWQQNSLEDIIEAVREKLMAANSQPGSPQPSTSATTSLQTHTGPSTATSWDVDRVTYRREKCFSVPMKCLLIPEEYAQQLQTSQSVGSGRPSGLSASSDDRTRDLPQARKLSETTQPSVDDAERRIAQLAVVETDGAANENLSLSVEDAMPDDDVIGVIDSDILPLANPWDIFPPPAVISSSCEASPEATPVYSVHNPTAAESKPDHPAVLTSTQLPVHSSKETSEHSKGEHSYLLPYQKPPRSSSLSTTQGSEASTSVNAPGPFTRLFNLSPIIHKHNTDKAQQNLPALDQESHVVEDMTETVERKYRKAKRKRSGPRPESPTTVVDEENSGSPPSWLFDTQAASRAKEGSTHPQGQTTGTVLRKTPTVHSDGSPFSYSYQVSGQNLQDLSQFKVSESLLHWTVKYLLVPKQADNPRSASATSNQRSSDKAEVTSLQVHRVE